MRSKAKPIAAARHQKAAPVRSPVSPALATNRFRWRLLRCHHPRRARRRGRRQLRGVAARAPKAPFLFLPPHVAGRARGTEETAAAAAAVASLGCCRAGPENAVAAAAVVAAEGTGVDPRDVGGTAAAARKRRTPGVEPRRWAYPTWEAGRQAMGSA